MTVETEPRVLLPLTLHEALVTCGAPDTHNPSDETILAATIAVMERAVQVREARGRQAEGEPLVSYYQRLGQHAALARDQAQPGWPTQQGNLILQRLGTAATEAQIRNLESSVAILTTGKEPDDGQPMVRALAIAVNTARGRLASAHPRQNN